MQKGREKEEEEGKRKGEEKIGTEREVVGIEEERQRKRGKDRYRKGGRGKRREGKVKRSGARGKVQESEGQRREGKRTARGRGVFVEGKLCNLSFYWIKVAVSQVSYR